MPKSVNITLDITVPSSTICKLSTLAINANIAATTSETADNELTLAIIYSIGRTGETANAHGVC